jgi:hypothetical protein
MWASIVFDSCGSSDGVSTPTRSMPAAAMASIASAATAAKPGSQRSCGARA